MGSIVISNHLFETKYNKLEMYIEDTPQEFVSRLENDCIQRTEVMQKTYKPMKLTQDEEEEFKVSNICYLC